jgi:competence protein ComEC
MAWWCYAGYCAAGLLLWFTCLGVKPSAQVSRRYWLAGALCVSAFALAFGQSGWRAAHHLQQTLAPDLEGRALSLVGVVSAMPQRLGDSWRFRFDVEDGPVGVPPRLLLGWYGNNTWGIATAGTTQPPLDLRAGDRWRFDVRLKAPHGHINPHGFDYELWLWEQSFQATGYVRTGNKDNAPEWLGRTQAHWIERARQGVRESIDAQVSDRQMAGLVAALLVGDQAAIERTDWDVFRATGVAHLMAISGLHITGLAWMAALFMGVLWRHSDRWSPRQPWSLWLPAPQAAQLFGCAVALTYALFTGWGVPAQRTVWMLVTVSLLRWLGRRWPWPHTWGVVCVVVLALDPWAMMQAGFWLSFVAVGVLFASGSPAWVETETLRQRVWQRVLGVLREQWLMSVCLSPLSLLLFHQVSVIGWLANLLAVPWVTLAVTPLCLLGLLYAPLWSIAVWFLQALMVCLSAMAAWSWATWSAPAAPGWVAMAAMLGMGVWALRLPGWMRLGGVSLVLPLLFWQAPRPESGTFELIAADMGQGHAVLLRTASHALLYDTGPRYSAETDAGQRVLVPLLRSLGERLDAVIISHQDSDHSGGAMSVLAMQPQARVWTSVPEGHPLQAIHPMQRCERGQHWRWDDVQFEVLHPDPEDYARRAKPNAMSCVLRVQSASGSSALLVGDIEASQEMRLIQQASSLQADWLLVPHHGSATSSTAEFLSVVQPHVAVVQSGYRNRFGHPRPEVLARYDARGVVVVQSARCGASTWHSDSPMLVRCEREQQQRYWHHRLP